MKVIASRSIVLGVAAMGLLIGTTAADGSVRHPAVVSENPVDYTPQVAPTPAVSYPHVDAIVQSGSTMYAGGLFQRVTHGQRSYVRNNFFAFDVNTGAVRAIDTRFDGQVFALEFFNDSIYAGGQFKTVNGIARRAVVKLNPDGSVDTGFDARVGGQVNDMEVRAGRLIIGGSSGKKLMALNPETGADTGYLNLNVSVPIPNAWGTVSVYDFAINPAGTKLVATGNFQSVSGQNRVRLFVVNLGATQGTLDSWYYSSFRKPCATSAPRRIAYLQGVDFSPNGSYFVVTATGQIPRTRAEIGETVCDAAARFNMNDDTKPAWINYTGGNSVWSVAVTGAAVYVQGHFQWLDNPRGVGSEDGGGAARRVGIGAINRNSGLALPWDPRKSGKMGGKSLLATGLGLWVASDSTFFNGEPRRGIALAPLP